MIEREEAVHDDDLFWEDALFAHATVKRSVVVGSRGALAGFQDARGLDEPVPINVRRIVPVLIAVIKPDLVKVAKKVVELEASDVRMRLLEPAAKRGFSRARWPRDADEDGWHNWGHCNTPTRPLMGDL